MELSAVVMVAIAALVVGFVLGRVTGGKGNVVKVPAPGPVPSSQIVRVSSAPDWEAEAREFLAAGSKIQAIKVVREGTNLGLKEAKDLVESW